MPFGDTRIISRKWSDHHAAVISTSFNASVSIGYPAGEPQYDPETDETTQAWSVDYAGAARIDHEAGRQAVESAGQVLVGVPYLVQLPAEVATFRRGARVKITAAINDDAAVGDVLWVVASLIGSERFNRDILCSDNASDAVVPGAAIP